MAATRAEHLKWCKERAIAEFDFSGRPQDAMASMISDLGKHPGTADSVRLAATLGMQLVANGHMSTRAQVVEFVNGFN